MKTKISKKSQMKIVIICCIALSVYALSKWSSGAGITTEMVFGSILFHIVIPGFLAWGVIYKKVLHG